MVRRTSRGISRSKKSDPGWKAPKWHRTNWVLPGPHRNGLWLRLSRARGQRSDALPPFFCDGHLDRRAASPLLPNSPKPFSRVALMTKRPPSAAAAPVREQDEEHTRPTSQTKWARQARGRKLTAVVQPCRYPVDGQMNCLHHALVGIAGPVAFA